MITPNLTDTHEYEKFSFEDLDRAISSMKNGKSTGGDQIPIELLKISDDSLEEKILNTFNDILSTEIIPSKW